MKVRAKIIGISRPFPGLEGPREILVEFPGNSVMDLLLHISSEADTETRGIFPTLVFFNARGKEIFRRSGVWDKGSIARKLNEAGAI